MTSFTARRRKRRRTGLPLRKRRRCCEKCSVLYVEQRAQNESEGNYIGFGLTERYDCVDWAVWASERFGEALPIYLMGVSLGGATVLMAAGDVLPDAVRGVIADSAYTSPREIWQ